MMGELTGGLIQMNAKMVVTGFGEKLIITGAFFAAAMLMIAVYVWTDKSAENRRRRRIGWILIALACVSAAAAAYGANTPRVKEIRACVDGPISLERICSVYDIVSIDGKEIVLRER